jgi:predicted phage terminase large subunit-like protein
MTSLLSYSPQFDPSQLQIAEKKLADELKKRRAKKEQCRRGGLIKFVRHFWHVLEPQTPLVDGWPLEAICQHLEAITFGDITRLLVNVPPGFMKSLSTSVFWPAWEWGPMNFPHLRYVAFSYSAGLTIRDNGRFRDLILSPEYQEFYGDRFSLIKVGEELISNNKTGWKLASSVGGRGTGERGNRVILDDPHNVKEAESEVIRSETVRWMRESMSNRLNDLQRDAIIVDMQRVHDEDCSGAIIEDELPYTHLSVPMEYDSTRHCETDIGWSDPRTEDGELAWEERFPADSLNEFKKRPFMWAGQYQQSPQPRGGGIIKRDWWQLWPSETFPDCEFVLASLDTAYTEKEENDPSALTIWGLFRDAGGNPKLVLLYAWTGRLELNDLVTLTGVVCSTNGIPDEDIEKSRLILGKHGNPVAYVPRLPVDKLVIEAKASGISVGQELSRLYGNKGLFGVELIDPTKWGDKTARMYAVQHMFTDDMIFAPDRAYAEMVIDQVEKFPKGSHDDLVDSTSLALRYMRLIGLAERKEEHSKSVTESMTFRPKQRPLYE